MADENTKEYVLAADGMRHEGRRYRRGDTVTLPADVGDRLVESGSLVNSGDDLPDRAPAALAPVADEASTLPPAQTIDEDGEPLPSSFGHPDRIAEAEEAAAEQEQRADATQPAPTRSRRARSASTATDEG